MRAMLAGSFAEAEQLAMAAFQSGNALGRSGTQGVFGVQLFHLRWQQGRLAEVEPLVRAVIAQSPDQPYLRGALALLLCETGRIEEARGEFDRLAAQSFADLPRNPVHLAVASTLADACAGVGDERRAALLYELLRPADGRALMVQPTVACMGPAARCLGRLAATMANSAATDDAYWHRARRHFEDAIGLAERMNAGPYVARSQIDYTGAILDRLTRARAAGRMPARHAGPVPREEAVVLLQRGLEQARALGMAGLEQRATRLLDELERLAPVAEPPATARQRNPAGLTPRELDVLRLLAAGKANNEIAEALTLSVYTVVRHVFNIYGKIGVRRRAEATAYALRTGLDEPAGEVADG
jgi:DNA-binding CsgD family transcriptional regulator